ncbi:paraneoplastic antigen Ma3-like [Asterias rubens]|uniref:paraneoplastic antigen Ma3-like n=1 Tax=Asterias rubens TaxID=7604 RepID=UPI001455194C|nr:paraneoplastic antigen Ma3-like [Asterias rubens]XP_033647065.1 paraneoplastic antigen Ma3-like [Asterias rubens]
MPDCSAELRELGLSWCKKEDLRVTHCFLLVSATTVHFPTDDIALALYQTINHLASVSRQDRDSQTLLLVEFDLAMKDVELPLDGRIRLDISDEQIVFTIQQFNSPREKVTIADLMSRGLLPSSSKDLPSSAEKQPENHGEEMKSTANGSKDVAVGLREALSMCKISNSRRLPSFSGSKQPARDEETFDLWVEIVHGQLEEESDEGEKRKRLREALRAPAANMITDYRRDNPQATAADYLTALELAFGDTQSAEELGIKFHQLHQKKEEKPSDFLTRLQGLLRKLIRKGGALPDSANSLLLSQFIRGTLYNDMMLINLRLKDKVKTPPTYLSLLQMVRREEAEQAEKISHREPESVSNPSAVSIPQQQPKTQAKSCKFDQRGDKGRANQRPNFCFKCGLEGHYRPKCANPSDPDKVSERFIQFYLQGNGKGHSKEADAMPQQN